MARSPPGLAHARSGPGAHMYRVGNRSHRSLAHTTRIQEHKQAHDESTLSPAWWQYRHQAYLALYAADQHHQVDVRNSFASYCGPNLVPSVVPIRARLPPPQHGHDRFMAQYRISPHVLGPRQDRSGGRWAFAPGAVKASTQRHQGFHKAHKA